MKLEEFKNDVHAQNVAVGWWDEENPCIHTKLQLISTEVAEATEGERKNLMDDKLPHRKMGEVELADVLIRTLDLMGYLKLTVDDETLSNLIADQPRMFKGHSAPRLHLIINIAIVGIARTMDMVSEKFHTLLFVTLQAGHVLGYDIIAAAKEKHVFNKSRADHKRSNRAQENGKKF